MKLPKVKRAYLYAGGAAVALGLLYWLWPKSAAGSSGPIAVAGTVTSGSQSVTIDDNVLSPTFGLVMPLVS